jgi:hypothetical protein
MDLNVMMREQAVAGLQRELDDAVTNGDTEAARKTSEKIAALAVSTAPKAPAFGDAEIRAELEKADWFGIDPKKSAKAVEFGKTMNPKKFATAAAFAEALIKAVNEDGKPPAPVKDEGDEDEPEEDEDDVKPGDKPAEKKPRKTDGPGEGDATQRGGVRRTSGPWVKMADAPADVQKEIKRSADKFVSGNAPKEQREKFIAKALESHYAAHQRNKGKK